MGSIFSFLRFDYGYGSSIPISDFNPHSEKNKNKKSKLLSPKDDILTESSSNKEDTESEEDSPMSAEKYQLQSYKKKEEEVPVISAEDYQLQTFKQKAEEGLPKDVTKFKNTTLLLCTNKEECMMIASMIESNQDKLPRKGNYQTFCDPKTGKRCNVPYFNNSIDLETSVGTIRLTTVTADGINVAGFNLAKTSLKLEDTSLESIEYYMDAQKLMLTDRSAELDGPILQPITINSIKKKKKKKPHWKFWQY